MKAVNIAIDGYSSCGKSTLAKSLAAHFNLIYVDSGAMYRAVTLYSLRKGFIKDNYILKDQLIEALPDIDISFSFNPESKRSETLLNGENVENEIRGIEVSRHVSYISLIKEVRAKLVAIQQQIGKSKGVIMDGRDIGTAVFPNADLKIFMTADRDTRTKRRYEELKRKGVEVSMDDISQNLASRDFEDTHRQENPLVQAADAKVIDNTFLTHDEQYEMAKSWIEEII